MSVLYGKSDRRILPRWRDSSKATGNADFLSLKGLAKPKVDLKQQLLEQEDDFAQRPSIGTAAEMLSLALLAGNDEAAQHAAAFIMGHKKAAPATLLKLASSVGNHENAFPSGPYTPSQSVSYTRHLLNLEPRNPVLWSDMARHFASLGNKHQAMRCMTTALSLAPNHRWMLRTASRFLVHQGDPVAAHKLLASHVRTPEDPWLIAAELACAQVAGRPPKFWRQATDILRFNRFAPAHTTELATAVAMMELEAGAKKRARKLVQNGLICPTENTLAQVFWAKENRHLNDGFELDQLVQRAVYAYEAEYQLKLLNGDLKGALQAAYTWGQDEPFAARPCMEIAYISSMLDDHKTTIEMASRVKKIDGRADTTLELNAIFADLSSGRLNVEEHKVELDHIKAKLLAAIKQADGDSYHAAANLGLWCYRYGDLSVGEQTYQLAISIAAKQHHNEAAAMAATFAAREAILARTASASALLQQAKEMVEKTKTHAGDFYIRKLEALALRPDKAKEILSPTSAEQYLKVTKPEVPSYRFERKGNQAVLWVPK